MPRSCGCFFWMDEVVPVRTYLGLIKLLAERVLYRAKGQGSSIMPTPDFREVWAEVVFSAAFFVLACFFRSTLFSPLA